MIALKGPTIAASAVSSMLDDVLKLVQFLEAECPPPPDAFVFSSSEWIEVKRRVPEELTAGGNLAGIPVYVAHTARQYCEMIYKLTHQPDGSLNGMKVGILDLDEESSDGR